MVPKNTVSRRLTLWKRFIFLNVTTPTKWLVLWSEFDRSVWQHFKSQMRHLIQVSTELNRKLACSAGLKSLGHSMGFLSQCEACDGWFGDSVPTVERMERSTYIRGWSARETTCVFTVWNSSYMCIRPPKNCARRPFDLLAEVMWATAKPEHKWSDGHLGDAW